MDRLELERLLTAAGQAAVADTLTGLWGHVLGVRTTLVAAGERPNTDGLETVAKRLWTSALDTWVRPVFDWTWRASHPGASSTAVDRAWEKTFNRLKWTVDLIVQAINGIAGTTSKLPANQLRSQVADALSLDAFTESLLAEIHDVELSLLDPGRSRTDTDADFARRIRLQTNVLVLNASRARSKGYAALARTAQTEDDARRFRDLARETNRPVSQLRTAERELDRHDEKLFHNPSLEPTRLAQLRAKLAKLSDEGSRGHETWRNSVTRDARAVATGLLNASTLQFGVDEARRTGVEWVKTWVATHDSRVRPEHRAADGQTVGILQPFTVGGEPMDHPGDFDASPENFWNCRCSMTVLTRAEYTELAAPQSLAAATMGETTMDDEELSDLPPVMWHGVISKEGVHSGDQRIMRPGAFRTQALPSPARFQREDWGGHDGAVVVANIEGARRYGEDIRGWGTFADGTLTPEVEEVIGLMATGMMRGTSIDGDDVLDSQFTLELDDSGDAYQAFDSIRLRGMTFCAIPAFDGAEVHLGPPPPEWLLEGEALAVEQNQPSSEPKPIDEYSDEELEAMLAASRVPENLAEYWTAGEGAAKIRWGQPGDFNRCREQLAKYVSPGQLSGMCANLHHRALGKWPGQEASLDVPYLMASVTGSTSLPVADRATAWDGPGARRRVLERYGNDMAAVSRAFLWRDPDADPATQAAWSLGFADIINGELRIVPRGVAATAGSHGVDALNGVSAGDKDRIRAKICTLYGKIRKRFDDWPECPFQLSASLTASAEGVPFSREQFMPRELGELTPITIDDDGNVYGHIFAWDSCHTGFEGVCVVPPRSKTGYALFHTGAVRLDDGTDLPVGKLTVGAGHANPNGLGVRGARAHYDNSAVAAAVVRMAEDKWGGQVSGRIIPGTPPEKIEELRRSPISGDWRTYQGNLELVAALGVNSPGFPIPRTMVASADGRQLSLVAAGYVARDNSAEIDALLAEIQPTAEEIDRQISTLVAAISPTTEA